MNNSIKPGTKLLRITTQFTWLGSQKGDVVEVRYVLKDGTIITACISPEIIYPKDLDNYVPDFIYKSPLYTAMTENDE